MESLTLDRLRRRHSVKWRHYAADVLPVWVAEMDTPLAEPIREVLREAVEAGDTGYATDCGYAEAFCGFASDRYGWSLDPSVPILVGDVMGGVVAALDAVSRPGDRVVISTPVYPPFYSFVGRAGRKVVASPLADTGAGLRLDPDRLDADLAGASVYLMCNPHNPAGHVLTREELIAVADTAERHGVTVISDEIHAPLTMPGERHIPFTSIDHPAAARAFTLHSASKAWNLAGLKAALLIPGPAAEVSDLPDDLWAAAGLFGALAGRAAFAECVDWLDEVRTGLDHNRTLLAALLAERLPEVGYRPPQATYLTWLDLRAYGLGADAADVLLEKGRLGVHNGTSFGAEGAGFVRLNIATSRAVLTEAVERMARALDRPASAA
ncbi:cystathionine beta-lyase [Stackebrandtia albiflava]|uniref:cysteine-S-conjugate beta-lyase n=1 Tax=Stackebrandtia albiflava TaxID=406432 RepID=A0A562VES5_9ACTN|nr:cystathionine beta-lyase [Stackebrandtia albiflava]